MWLSGLALSVDCFSISSHLWQSWSYWLRFSSVFLISGVTADVSGPVPKSVLIGMQGYVHSQNLRVWHVICSTRLTFSLKPFPHLSHRWSNSGISSIVISFLWLQIDTVFSEGAFTFVWFNQFLGEVFSWYFGLSEFQHTLLHLLH